MGRYRNNNSFGDCVSRFEAKKIEKRENGKGNEY